VRKNELIIKSREAMLAAVQIYNNPMITFKAESFITLAIIAWTYLMHAYYKMVGINYRYGKRHGKRMYYDKTKYGAYKNWELERCMDDKSCPLDKVTCNNLKFLIGIRHEIEHQMTKKIDSLISAKLQSCAINFNFYMKELFDGKFGLDNELGMALQFSPIMEEQKEQLLDNERISSSISNFIMGFESDLSDDDISNEKYAYRVMFTKINAKRKGQADKVMNFISSDSPFAEGIKKEDCVFKEIEKKKYIPSQIVKKMNDLGYKYFTMHYFISLWKSVGRENLKNQGYCTLIADKKWMWYENWVKKVEEHCKKNDEKYRFNTNVGNKERVYLPSEIVKEIKLKGFDKYRINDFTEWRKSVGIEKDDKKYGFYNIQSKWVWKKIVLKKALKYCNEQGELYRE